MSEWQEYKLDQVYSFSSGLSKKREEFGFGYPFLAFKDVFHNFFVPTELENLANTTERERQRCSIRKGDVFLTRTSETQDELGMSCVALNDIPNATFNGFTKRLRPNGEIEILPTYAGYYFRSPKFRATVSSMSSITTRASLNNSMLSDLVIVVPPVNIQGDIAAVLSSLDDKIDLLHRQNKTLEALAQTLFRHWFIENASDDWEEYLLRDFVTHQKQNVKPNSKPKEQFYHYSLPAFDDGQKPITEVGDEIRSNKYKVTPFSILVSKLNPRFPRIWDVYFEPEPNSICSTEFQVFEPHKKDYFGFIYFLLKSQEVTAELQMAASGTSGSHQRVKPDDILNVEIFVPNKEKIAEFSKLIEPNLLMKIENKKQIRTLEKLRDTLLPKLMSGAVRVRS